MSRAKGAAVKASGPVRAALVLLTTVVVGFVVQYDAERGLPGLEGIGFYPIGLLPVALVQVDERRQRAAVLVVAAVSTALALWLGGQSAPEAVAYGIGGAVAAWVVLAIISGSGPDGILRSERDLLRLLAAVGAGGLVIGAAAFAGGALTGLDHLEAVSSGSAAHGFASLLLWVPLAMVPRRFVAIAGQPERLLHWSLLITTTLMIFALVERPSLAYVVLALLVWSGLRFSLLEALVQLIAVRAVAVHFSVTGRGPYAQETLGIGLPPDLDTIWVELFLILCSVTVVGVHLSSVRQREAVELLARSEAEAAAAQELVAMFQELEHERSTVEELRELDRVKDSFVSMVSHELRTPITNIIGYTEMLDDGDYGDLSDPQRQATTRIEENSHRLMHLIDDLLTLSRLRSATLEMDHQPVDLVAVVRAAERIMVPRIRSAGLSLEMDLTTHPLVVPGDRDQLERVLVNLVSNAVKFTPKPGRIGLRLREHGDYAELTVSDTGYGIPAEELDRLFGQFFRSSVATDHHIPGTGLGLSIVRAIVEGHGGTVSVSSTVGEGTRFLVQLPRGPEGPSQAG